ncbi:MAG: fibronectin type III domain-containing protein [Candidatus Angelobacter sp.]
MKRTLTLLGLGLLLSAPAAFAQKPMDQASEKAVQITQGPSITNISGNTATINWTTNSSGANHVRYRVAGSNSAWKSAYHAGGGTSHSLQLTGLEPGKTYEWQILTTDGDVRTAGQFQSAATAGGTAPDVNAPASAVAGAPAQGPAVITGGTKVPLYRSVSNTTGGHLYSTTANDQAGSYKSEGIAGYLMSSQVSGTQPLYRLSSSKGDTLLTTDANLRASAQGQGYKDEGIIGYVASQQVAGTLPLYQTSTADGLQHFYTTSSSERDQILGRGWKDQGISGFIWTQQ